jgi:hypothetical protein
MKGKVPSDVIVREEEMPLTGKVRKSPIINDRQR